jgi:putative transposase
MKAAMCAAKAPSIACWQNMANSRNAGVSAATPLLPNPNCWPLVFSRYILAWTVGERESSSIFQSLMLQATLQQEIAPDQLTLHSDRGGPMKSKSTAQLLTDLGVMRSLSRPHTSNDNPFIESCFRTTKYHPDFPERFETLEKAQAYMAEFMHWYNHDHHHSGIAFLTPFQLHSGQADDIISQRQTILDKAFSVNPSRFKKPPVHPPAPTQAWINPPKLILPPTTLEVPR